MKKKEKYLRSWYVQNKIKKLRIKNIFSIKYIHLILKKHLRIFTKIAFKALIPRRFQLNFVLMVHILNCTIFYKSHD